MSRSKTTSSQSSSQQAAPTVDVAELVAELASLKAEVAELKKLLKEKSSSSQSSDPRVEVIWNALVKMGKEKLLR